PNELGRLIESVSMTSPVVMSCPGIDGSTRALVVMAPAPMRREIVDSLTWVLSSRADWFVQCPTERSPVGGGEMGATSPADGGSTTGYCSATGGAGCGGTGDAT